MALRDFKGLLTNRDRIFASLGRTFGSPPDQSARTEWELRQARNLLSWAIYDGSAYDRLEEWTTYKQENGLVEDMRLFVSHVKRLVDFYRVHIYNGDLSDDGSLLPDGSTPMIELNIPDGNTQRKKLGPAIGQLWQWWGWVDMAPFIVATMAVTGTAVVELEDDVRARKIRAVDVWPGYVAELKVNRAGHVTLLAKEYEVYDPDADNGKGETYVYRREMDKTEFRTFKDGEPFDYDGFGLVRKNPYSFVPAVAYRAVNTGGPWGEPMFHGSQGQLDLINSLYTSMYGMLRTQMDMAVFVAGDNVPGSVAGSVSAFDAQRDDASGGLNPPAYNPDDLDIPSQMSAAPYPRRVPTSSLRLQEVAPGTEIIIPKADVSQVRENIRDLKEWMESQFPEITFWASIRDMPTVTKPGVESAMGDVIARFRSVSSLCDRQTVKLQNMAVAMGGERMRDGTWRKFAEQASESITEEQERFLGFDLGSYTRGELTHSIVARSLVSESDADRRQAAKDELDLGMPEPVVWETAGRDLKEQAEWVKKNWISDPGATSTAANADNVTTQIDDALGSLSDINVPPVIEPA